MRIAVPHNTTKDAARQIVDRKLEQLLSEFGGRAEEVEHQWTADTLQFKGKARGISISGTVEVTPEVVIVEAKLPLLAKPFGGRIRETVEREAEGMFRQA